MPPHSILLIDNNPAYCKQVVDDAKRFRLLVTSYHNLEEGMEALRNSRTFKAVILDDRCTLNPSQVGEGKSNFVIRAILTLDNVEHSVKRMIPYCVNCENKEEFREHYDGIAKLFTKGIDHDAMFRWLLCKIDQLPEVAIRKEFARIFEQVSGRFTDEQEQVLIDLLELRGTDDPTEVRTGLAMIRTLLEVVVDLASSMKLGKQPWTFKDVKMSRTRLILEALNRTHLPEELFNEAVQLYRTCSKYGNHFDGDKPGVVVYRPGRYALERRIYSMLELVDYLFKE